jgi:hypothetical protein
MSVRAPVVIEADNLSVAWSRALLSVWDRTKSDLSPIVVSISGFPPPLPTEIAEVRAATDAVLGELQMSPVRVSALTIIPYEMWCRRNKPSCSEFKSFCIDRLLPRMKALNSLNRNGTYFERLMDFKGTARGKPRTVNQLQFVINLLANRTRWPRESALQMSCFDPAKDHTGQPVRGFPCLQQVGVAHDGDGNIAISAYYPTQYIFDRAYGNYLGLCQLGAFIAHETGLRFVRLNCFVGRPTLGSVSRRKIADLVTLVREHT